MGWGKGGNVVLSSDWLKNASATFTASNFAHEGQHGQNAGRFTGPNAWKDEAIAEIRQVVVGIKFGAPQNETNYLIQHIVDKDWLQKHMENGIQ
jgi:acyl-CoA reductase-like NAD-dependent aldehyde dehydrogenase